MGLEPDIPLRFGLWSLLLRLALCSHGLSLHHVPHRLAYIESVEFLLASTKRDAKNMLGLRLWRGGTRRGVVVLGDP